MTLTPKQLLAAKATPGPCGKCGRDNPIALASSTDGETIRRLCWPCYREAMTGQRDPQGQSQ